MKSETIELSPRVSLTCVGTDKFKTGCVSVSFVTPLTEAAASKNALLPRVLRRGTSVHPDMDAIAAALNDLYGARIEPYVRKKGENHCVGFYADFVDDDFVPEGERVLERTLALLGEMLLSPRTHGGLLLAEYVDGERRNLSDDIRAAINDKRLYARNALLQNMCSGEAYGVDRLGTLASAETITARNLTAHYHELIENSHVEIIYCGNSDFKRVEIAVTDAFTPLLGGRRAEEPVTELLLSPPSDEVRRFREEFDVNQGKLSLGFRLGETMLTPNYAALTVFNAIFGGSVTSKLFENVREKLSLCYYASSAIERLKGILIVSSGVSFENFDRAEFEILAQLDAIRAGDVSDYELTSARRAVITDACADLDSPAGVEAAYFEKRLAKLPYSPEEFAALADAVTREEVVAIAKSVKLDSVYYLTGKNLSENPMAEETDDEE